MRLDIHGPRVVVTLSERNLRTLLSKVHRPDSARTLLLDVGEGVLVVKAETDEEHYRDRVPAGPVHPLDDPDTPLLT